MLAAFLILTVVAVILFVFLLVDAWLLAREHRAWARGATRTYLQAHGPVEAPNEGLAALQAPEPVTHRGEVDEHRTS